MTPKSAVLVYLPPKIVDRLRDEADKEYTSVSAVTRRIVIGHYEVDRKSVKAK